MRVFALCWVPVLGTKVGIAGQGGVAGWCWELCGGAGNDLVVLGMPVWWWEGRGGAVNHTVNGGAVLGMTERSWEWRGGTANDGAGYQFRKILILSSF